MELRDLTYLLEVAHTAHLGRAAERLGLTQPALTKCIARLEAELRVALLERTPKGVALTEYGRHLVRHAERLRAADLDVRRALDELATGRAGHVRIGTGFVLAQYVLPAACVILLQRHPSITLDVITGNSESLFPALREGRVDLVLADVTAVPRPGLRQVQLLEDRVVVIARRGHRLQRLKRLSVHAMARERWAMPAEGTLPALWLAQRWRELGIDPPACAVRSGSLPTLLKIVSATDLLMFQSWATVERNTDYARLLQPLPSGELTWRHGIGVTLRDSGHSSPALERVVESLREAAVGEAVR